MPARTVSKLILDYLSYEISSQVQFDVLALYLAAQPGTQNRNSIHSR